MENKRNNLRENMKAGLSSLVRPTTVAVKQSDLRTQEKPKYKTCNYITDPSRHNRLKRYATDNGMTLLQAFNEAIDQRNDLTSGIQRSHRSIFKRQGRKICSIV